MGLHDVKLGAEVATNFVCITVPEAVGIPQVALFVLAWVFYEIEGCNTAVVALAQVNVVLDGAPEQVRLEESLRVSVGQFVKVGT